MSGTAYVRAVKFDIIGSNSLLLARVFINYCARRAVLNAFCVSLA